MKNFAVTSTFFDSIRNNFLFMKSSKNLKESYLKSIDLDKYTLCPIGQFSLEDNIVIDKMSNWRNENSEFFLDNFKTDFKGTKKWLKSTILDNEDRILFFIFDKLGNLKGHIGFQNCKNFSNLFEFDHLTCDQIEIDDKNIIIETLINWARDTINVENFIVKIISDHKDQISFYENLDFKIINEKSTIENFKPNEVKYLTTLDQNIKKNKKLSSLIYVDPLKSKEKILTAGPSITQKEVFYAYDAALNGWNDNSSFYTNAFQKKFSEKIGSKYCIATSSCTGAMQTALMALEIKEGDEVIVPDITWVSTASVVASVGATPVFVDVKLNDWTIDENQIEKSITEKTKAIMPVHLYGMPSNCKIIYDIAKKYNLKIVEDSAPAIGSTFEKIKCGTFGDFGAFSFQGAKLAVTGEGGMLVTDNEELYLKALKIWDFGRNPNKTFWIDKVGTKFKISNIQSAIGLAQIERIDEMIYMKRRIFNWYKKYLNQKNFNLIEEGENQFSIYWMSCILLNDGFSRDELVQNLREANIDTRPCFPSISEYPIWKKKRTGKLENSKKISNLGLNLPSGVLLREGDIKRVSETINSFYK